jgi:hypothetical protein
MNISFSIRFSLIIVLFAFIPSKAQMETELCDQFFVKGSFEVDPDNSFLRIVDRNELARVINSDVGTLNSLMFEGSSEYLVTCFDDYIAFPVSTETLMVYDLVRGGKLHELNGVLGFPARVLKVRDSVYAMSLNILGVSDGHSIVVDLISNEVLSASSEGFRDQTIRLVMNQRILAEGLAYDADSQVQALTVYRVADELESVQRCSIKTITQDDPNFLPFGRYALSNTVLYGIWGRPMGKSITAQQPSQDEPLMLEFVSAIPLPQCQNVAAELGEN